MKKKERIMLVDGYNLIGADKELFRESKISLETARNHLLKTLAEYNAVQPYTIICVFDAYEVKSKETVIDFHGLTVVYTKEKETADDYIEKYVKDNYNKFLTEITVVTSDMTEQNTIFALGALRKSSREMWESLRHAKKNISHQITTINQKLSRKRLDIPDETMTKLEKLRRDKK